MCQFILTVLFALALQTYMWLLEFPKIEQETEPSPVLWIQLPVWAQEKDRPSLLLRLDLFFYISLLEVNTVSVKHPLIYLSCLFAILLYILFPLALSWLHIWVLNTVLCWHYIDRQLRIVWLPAESICCQMEAMSKVYGTTGLAVSLVLLLVHQPQKLIVKTMDYCIFFVYLWCFFMFLPITEDSGMGESLIPLPALVPPFNK